MGNPIDGATARPITVDTTLSDAAPVNKGDTLKHDADAPAAEAGPATAHTTKSGLPAAPPPDSEAASAMKATLQAKTQGSGNTGSHALSGATSGGAGGAKGTSTTVKYAGPPHESKEAQHQKFLKELGNRPDEAHAAWKKLGIGDRMTVLANMERRYGKDFTKQFYEAAKTGKSEAGIQNVYSSDPSSKMPTATNDQLKAWGYKYAGEDPRGEVWVKPSGKVILRDTSTWKFGDNQPAAPSSPTGPSGPAKTDGGDEIDDGGVRDQQDKAVELLGHAQRALQEARELMNHQPVNWDEANAKAMEAYFALGELESLMGQPNSSDPNPNPPDMSQVYPGFQQELEAAQQEYGNQYNESMQKDPAQIQHARETEELQKQMEEMDKNQGSGN